MDELREYTPAKIKDINEADRPRERLQADGAEALATAELLAILVGSGNKEENAVMLMSRILRDYNHRLNDLGRATIEDLCRYKGMGPAKAISILAACELGKRRMAEEVAAREQIKSSADIYAYFLPRMKDLDVEQSHVLLLNNALRVISSKCISTGGRTGTVVDIRVVLETALRAHALNIVLCHNHPSGNVRPSAQDDNLTQRLRRACETMDIRLIDHLVVTDGSYYSYADEGTL